MKMKYAIASALAAGIATSHAAIGIGDSIVDKAVEMKSVDGSMITLDSIKGEKGTLVIFSCNHCPDTYKHLTLPTIQL